MKSKRTDLIEFKQASVGQIDVHSDGEQLSNKFVPATAQSVGKRTNLLMDENANALRIEEGTEESNQQNYPIDGNHDGFSQFRIKKVGLPHAQERNKKRNQNDPMRKSQNFDRYSGNLINSGDDYDSSVIQERRQASPPVNPDNFESRNKFDPVSNLQQLRKTQMYKFSKINQSSEPGRFNLLNSDSMYQTTPEESQRNRQLNQTSQQISAKEQKIQTSREESGQMRASSITWQEKLPQVPLSKMISS